MNKPTRNKPPPQIKIANGALVDVPNPSIIRGIIKTNQNDGF